MHENGFQFIILPMVSKLSFANTIFLCGSKRSNDAECMPGIRRTGKIWVVRSLALELHELLDNRVSEV